MEQDVHEYSGRDVTVTFDVKRCIHARECVRGLPAVFDRDARPWVRPDEADADAVAEVVARCPTGALHYERDDGGPGEPVPAENTVTVVENGPHYVRGDVVVETEDGDRLLADTRIALCRCGASGNKPLCDNSHLAAGFEADGRVAGATDAGTAEQSGGPLRVTPTRNGPLHVEGAFEIRGRADASRYRGEDEWLCRCGASGSKPFCDDTHLRIGFTTGDE